MRGRRLRCRFRRSGIYFSAGHRGRRSHSGPWKTLGQGVKNPKVHDRTTQKCTVADKPPVTNIRTINLATDAIYKTRREAESAMKAIKVCSAQK
jgi:hypothetical protein